MRSLALPEVDAGERGSPKRLPYTMLTMRLPPLASIATSFRAKWRTKLALTLLLTGVFCVPYFTLQRVLVLPVRTLPFTAIDRAVDFNAHWVWVYQSVYVLLLLVPWMMTTREQLREYATGFIVLSIAGFICFFFMPVRGPRPDSAITNPMFRFLTWYDRPLNCFPSLHVGLAVYTLLVATRLFDEVLPRSLRDPALLLGWAWTALIAYAALATKQHYAIDLPAGALLACLCHWSTWHIAQRSLAHAETPMGLSRTSVFNLVRNRGRGADASFLSRN